jgi:hypothetical protein
MIPRVANAAASEPVRPVVRPADAPRPLLKHGGDRRSAKFRGNAVTSNGAPVPLNKGNSAAYLLAVLDRDRPDFAARVRARDLSAYGAAVEAGFRKRNYRRGDTKSCHNPSSMAQCH